MALFAGTAYRATIALQGWSADELLAREKALGAQLHIIESASTGTGAVDRSTGLAVETFTVSGDGAAGPEVPQPPAAATSTGETEASPATPRAKHRRPTPKASAQRAPKTNTRFK